MVGGIAGGMKERGEEGLGLRIGNSECSKPGSLAYLPLSTYSGLLSIYYIIKCAHTPLCAVLGGINVSRT